MLKQLKVETVLIPAGCTRFVQPADVSWNAPFKRKLRSFNEEWMFKGDHKTTGAGNPRPPQPETYLHTKLDGSEDAVIHCPKEGNGMPDGVVSLIHARQQAQAKDLSQLMQGLEVEAPEDPEDDAGNDSDVSVINAEDQVAEESEEFEEEEDSDSDF